MRRAPSSARSQHREDLAVLHVVDKTGPSRERVQASAREDEGSKAPAGVDNTALRAFVERIARLHEERKAIGDDIRDIYAEAKAQGFDKHGLKAVVSVFGDPEKQTKRRETAEIVEIYLSAMGIS